MVVPVKLLIRNGVSLILSALEMSSSRLLPLVLLTLASSHAAPATSELGAQCTYGSVTALPVSAFLSLFIRNVRKVRDRKSVV